MMSEMTPQMMAKICSMAAAGLSVSDIAEDLSISHSAVELVLDQYQVSSGPGRSTDGHYVYRPTLIGA